MKKVLTVILRVVICLLAVACIAFGIIGRKEFLAHLIVFGVLVLFTAVCWGAFKKNGEVAPAWKKLRRILAVVLIVLTLADCVFMIVMTAYAGKGPVEGEEYTMVVLGTGTDGDQPGDLLKYRLDTAGEYLLSHPDMKVVVTGKGDGEYTEAEVMYRYLVKMGVDSQRIFKEEQATSTQENFTYSKAIVESEGLPAKLLVVTNDYHEMRAGGYAKDLGMDTTPLRAPTTAYLWFPLSERERCLMVREMFD